MLWSCFKRLFSISQWLPGVVFGLFLVGAPVSLLADGMQPDLIKPVVGEQYFTRYSFKYEKGRHDTTNYWRGDLVPVNSRVKLVALDRKTMSVELDDGSLVKFINRSKYTKRRMKTIASELLSPSVLSLKKLKSATREAIEAGEMRLGMTREQVIMARGFPPRHKTPSTSDNTWTYWSSKFVQRRIVFENGLLARGRGLH